MPDVNEKFVLMEHYSSGFSSNFYAYSAIFYDANTSFGWRPVLQSRESEQIMHSFGGLLEEKNCAQIKENLEKVQAKQVIAEENDCNVLLECGFSLKKKIENYCLLNKT
ncbi:MAG: hypothetical protein V1494_00875 [Candidatus Diapherotrites archaeon]